MPQRHRADDNQKELVSFARSIPGFIIVPINGIFDAVGYYKFTDKVYVMDFKNKKGRNKLTKSQENLLRIGFPLHIIREHDDILKMLGITKT